MNRFDLIAEALLREPTSPPKYPFAFSEKHGFVYRIVGGECDGRQEFIEADDRVTADNRAKRVARRLKADRLDFDHEHDPSEVLRRGIGVPNPPKQQLTVSRRKKKRPVRAKRTK